MALIRFSGSVRSQNQCLPQAPGVPLGYVLVWGVLFFSCCCGKNIMAKHKLGEKKLTLAHKRGYNLSLWGSHRGRQRWLVTSPS